MVVGSVVVIKTIDSNSYLLHSLLNQLQLDEKAHGHVNVSMMRICWNLCRNRLLLINLIHLLITVAWIVAAMLCLPRILISANTYVEYLIQSSILNVNETTPTIERLAVLENMHKTRRNNQQSYVAYVAIMLVLVGLKCASKALALSTAVRLRNACAGAVYLSAVRSSVRAHVSSHRIVALCGDDGDAILDLVQKGGIIGAQSLGVLLCIGVAVPMMSTSVLLGIVGVSGIEVLVVS